MNPNLVSFSFTDDDFAAIKQKIGELQAEIDKFAIELHFGDMRELKTLGDRSLAFTEQAYLIATQQKEMLPGFMNVEEFTKDFTLFKQTNELIKLLEVAMERLRDTYYAAGSDSFTAARKIYNSVKYAVKTNTVGAEVAYEDLKRRFSRIADKKTEPEQETDKKDTKNIQDNPPVKKETETDLKSKVD
jgi:hypothetical protein